MRPRINGEIRSSVVYLVDEDGKSHGEVNTNEALSLAREKQIDLIEISPKANPPVAKLMEIGKYLYEQQKKQAKQKSKQKGGELKEVRLTLKIEDHDFQTKARKAQKFLNNRDKVKVMVVLKGRENIFPERANDLINNFAEAVEGEIEQKPTRLGNRVSTVIKKR